MSKVSLVTIFSAESSEYKDTLLQMPLYVAALRLSNQLNKCMVWDVVKCRQSFGQIVAKQKLYYADVNHWTLMEAG
jgi:hypothetical protein